MVHLERTLFDRLIHNGLLNKRKIGRPLKINIQKKEGMKGTLQIMYQPKNFAERTFSKFMFSILPYLCKFTFQFHQEKARLAGLRVEDMYEQKFWKEQFIYWHIYAQNFHPSTLHERVRDVRFYRLPHVLFKGFYAPDWAKNHVREGADIDLYSRQLWNKAQQDFKSEWTPHIYDPQRFEPVPLNWLRIEFFGKGYGSRLFFNETPNPRTFRHGGHLQDINDLYSFKHADNLTDNLFGVDGTTPQGKQKLEEIVKYWKELAPGIFDDCLPERNEYVSSEPHFLRVWHHYRQFLFKERLQKAIRSGDLTEDDVSRAKPFFDANGLPSPSLYRNAVSGRLGDMSSDPSFQALQKVFTWTGLDKITFSSATSTHAEEQFWAQFD